MPWTKVFLDKDDLERTLTRQNLRALSFREALREAQAQAMEADPRVFVMGEGINDPGGIFGSTRGLKEQFGPKRVLEIPIAENGLTGVAIGAAAAGMRPIFVHMRMDFLPMCMDQIANHAAKWHYMTGGKVRAPLTIRSIIGRGWGSAAQHSQALHGLFLGVAGLKLAVPSTPYDAKGLLLSAIEDGGPVLLAEHRWLYDVMGYVPQERYRVPLGQAVVRRAGKDVTVVAVSQMVYEAAKAAATLAKEGIEVEIIDPRTLKPLDEETIVASVRKTGRLVVADVGCLSGGFTADVVCRVCESALGALRARPRRVALPDAPTPASAALEQAYYPGAAQIIAAVKATMQGN